MWRCNHHQRVALSSSSSCYCSSCSAAVLGVLVQRFFELPARENVLECRQGILSQLIEG
jgi:hypothetical protein